MPKFRHTYPYARNFPALGLTVQPGEVITRAENPDANFFEEVAPKADKAAPKSAEPTSKETD